MGVVWGVTLFCVQCGRGKVIKFPAKEQEVDCDICGMTEWKSADNPSERFPYHLNHNDKRFLRSIRVSAE